MEVYRHGEGLVFLSFSLLLIRQDYLFLRRHYPIETEKAPFLPIGTCRRKR
jgi:hypothetical protein